ncbi:cannabidiolic acid synthase-like [Arachis hypogaea]|uniref:cannabidiolic acid synthase-like n=1 Tax=Arachis hypogaea TaxID=3818 RepID=UPI000DECEA81|nr:cannabidiolic acid synthase-like [Arachis hypogaea]
MSEIPESATVFPHRKGMLYGIQYSVSWNFNEDATKYIKWIRTLYDYLAPYVSKLPRRAYLNYRDLDLGVNGPNTNYVETQSWGLKYFNYSFKRLVEVKARVDLGNFFKNEQSIPIGAALDFMFKL